MHSQLPVSADTHDFLCLLVAAKRPSANTSHKCHSTKSRLVTT